jgi:hypothetical protein
LKPNGHTSNQTGQNAWKKNYKQNSSETNLKFTQIIQHHRPPHAPPLLDFKPYWFQKKQIEPHARIKQIKNKKIRSEIENKRNKKTINFIWYAKLQRFWGQCLQQTNMRRACRSAKHQIGRPKKREANVSHAQRIAFLLIRVNSHISSPSTGHLDV